LGILDSPRRLMERSRKILLPIEQANINDARWLCQLSRTAGGGAVSDKGIKWTCCSPRTALCAPNGAQKFVDKSGMPH